MRMARYTPVICAAALLGTPVGSQEATTPAPAAPSLNDLLVQQQIRQLQIANDDAERKRILDAEERRLKAIEAIPAADGSSKVEQGGGALEAALLAASAAAKAAEHVATQVAKNIPALAATHKNTVILVAGDSQPSVDLFLTFKEQATRLAGILERDLARQRACPDSETPSKQSGPGDGLRTLAAPAAIPAAGLVTLATRLFASSATLSGVQLTPDTPLLLAAVATQLRSGHRNIRSYLPGTQRTVALDNSNAAVAAIESVVKAQDEIRKRIDCLKPAPETNKASLAALAKLDEEASSFIRTAISSGAGGQVPLVEAARQADLMSLIDAGVPVLRVRTGTVGGSALAIRNIATTFGAAGLKVAGGLIASWTLENPKDGLLLASGTVAVSCGLGTVRSAHQKDRNCPFVSSADQQSAPAAGTASQGSSRPTRPEGG